MEYTGSDIHADYELAWEAVSKSFPTMAAAYRAANVATHCTNSVDGLATDVDFVRSWRPLRDEAEDIFAHAANNLNDAAVAIGESLQAYAGADDDARAALESATADLPDEVPEIGETTVPHSKRYYYSPEYYDPPPPDYSYEGDAPTVAELKEKAATVEDKLWEAAIAEMAWLEGEVMSWFSRDWLLGTADGDAVEEASGGIVDAVSEAAKNNPADFETAVASLESIGGEEIKLFNTFNTEVANAKDGLDPDVWDSEAAGDFRKNFLNAYSDIADTHVLLLGTLAGSMAGYRDGLEATYRAIDEAMDSAIDSCNAIINSGSSQATGLATAALSAVIAVAGVVYTGGTSGAIAWSLAGGGVSIGAAAMTGGGNNVDAVKSNLLDAVSTAKDNLDQLDSELSEKLGSDLDSVIDARYKPDMKLDLPKPEFTYYGAEPF